MIVRVSDDNLLVDAETESMRGVELGFSGAENTEFRSDLHVSHLGGLSNRRVEISVARVLSVDCCSGCRDCGY